MTAKFATTRLASSSAGARGMPAAERRFSRPRFALLVLAGVYPLITLLLYLVLPLLDGWPIWQETVVIAPIMVTIMVWGLIPTVQRVFRGFLNPAAN
jgi:antibiotic biosynthesis monooxygenase (ABM) superfamily enzyme